MGQSPQPPIPLQPLNVDIGQLFNANKPVGSKALLEAIAKERKGNIISLVYIDFLPINPMLAGDVARWLEPTILELGKSKKLDLVLRSTGGVAEIPWRIVSVLRCFCEELEVVVPRGAQSGATHIAIAADNMVMGPLSYLGSVDPTRNHPLLPRDPQTNNPTPASVQDLKHCLEFVRRNVKKNEPMGSIVNELFNKVNPLAIGAIEQSYELSRLITRKVLGARKKKLPRTQVENIVDRLAGKYFSHGYPISREEVTEDLGLPVTRVDVGNPLFNAVEALNAYYSEVFEKSVEIPAGPAPLSFRITGFLETTKSRRILCQVFGPNGQPMVADWFKETNS
jgi:hypothetical protein